MCRIISELLRYGSAKMSGLGSSSRCGQVWMRTRFPLFLRPSGTSAFASKKIGHRIDPHLEARKGRVISKPDIYVRSPEFNRRRRFSADEVDKVYVKRLRLLLRPCIMVSEQSEEGEEGEKWIWTN